MIDTPETNTNNDQPDDDLQKIGTSPESPDTAKPDSEQQKSKQDREYAQYIVRPLKATGRGIVATINWVDSKGPFITAIATVVIAVLTGIYVHYSRAQWKVMGDQLSELHTSAQAAKNAAEVAQDTLKEIRNEDRPWVYVKSMNIHKIEPGKWIEVDVAFANFGHTPALDTQPTAKLHITSDPRAPLPPLGHVEGERTSIFLVPMAETHSTTHTVDIVSSQTVEQVKKPGVRFYVYGRGTYRDTTKDRLLHHFEYCTFFSPYNASVASPCVGQRYGNTSD